MSPTDPITPYNFSSPTPPRHSQHEHHTTTFTLQSLHFSTVSYEYPIIMASPSADAARAKPAKSASASSGGNATNSTKPDCWTDEHDAHLKDLAAKGEDVRSIVVLMETDFPCLRGKLSKEWLKEKMKGVEVIG